MTKKEISFLEQLQNKNEDMQKFEKQMKDDVIKKVALDIGNNGIKFVGTWDIKGFICKKLGTFI